jgi:hypothetical protein
VLCLVRSRTPLQIGADRAHRLLKSLGQGQIAVRLQEGDEAVDGGLGRLGASLVTADTIGYDKQVSEGSGGPGDAVLVFGAFPADVALDADGYNYGRRVRPERRHARELSGISYRKCAKFQPQLLNIPHAQENEGGSQPEHQHTAEDGEAGAERCSSGIARLRLTVRSGTAVFRPIGKLSVG